MNIDELTSPGYRKTIARMHENDPTWGAARPQWIELVAEQLVLCNPGSVLDYGCGKGWMGDALARYAPVAYYDPAIPGRDTLPAPADFVVCNDVLEHIEPDKIESVLGHLSHVTKRALFANIVLREARRQTLPDGRNPHVLVRPRQWWREMLGRWFDVREIPGRGKFDHEMTVMLYPRVYQPILIAAPPRSGTSLLASFLAACGVHVGETVPSDSGNPYGYYESTFLVELNKAILKANGQRGKSEPPMLADPVLPFDLQAVAREEAQRDAPWLFKDSKTLRVWRVWADAFPGAKWLLPRRDITAIVDSMSRHPVWARRGGANYFQKCAQAFAAEQTVLAEHVRYAEFIDANELASGDETVAEDVCQFVGVRYKPDALGTVLHPEAWHG